MFRDVYFSSKSPHQTHEEMYRYDSPFYKRYGIKSLGGKSAYDIAVENGFNGTIQEWLESLQGITPHIGENGNWFIGDQDTGISTKVVSDYRILINKPFIEGKEMIDDVELDSVSNENIDSFFDS